MTFSRDISHYRATPRTLQSSKFGPYARITKIEDRQHWTQEAAEYIGYAVAGLVVGACCVFAMLGAYRALCWMVTQ